MRHETRSVIVRVVIILAIAGAFAGVDAVLYNSLDQYVSYTIVPNFLHLVLVVNPGPAFGILTSETVSAIKLVAFFWTLLLAVVLMSMVSWRFRIQNLLLFFVLSDPLNGVMERWFLPCGNPIVYLDFSIGATKFPLVNFSGLLASMAGIGFVVLGIMRFFGLLRRMQERHTDQSTRGCIADPLYRYRWQVKSLGYTGASFVALESAAPLVNPPSPEGIALAVLVIALIMLPTFYVLRRIPKRDTDILYFRAFKNDRASKRLLKTLRRTLKRGHRVSGVINPRDLRRPMNIMYFLVSNLFFGFGDLNNVNAFGYNLYIEGEWKEAVRTALKSCTFAIFDCRAATENLEWEIRQAQEAVGEKNVFYIVPDTWAPDKDSRPGSAFRQDQLAGLTDAILNPPSVNS